MGFTARQPCKVIFPQKETMKIVAQGECSVGTRQIGVLNISLKRLYKKTFFYKIYLLCNIHLTYDTSILLF